MTRLEKRCLDFFVGYRREYGGGLPTLREIGEAIGCDRATSAYLILELAERGSIVRSPLGRRVTMRFIPFGETPGKDRIVPVWFKTRPATGSRA